MSDRIDLKALLDTPPWDWPSDAAQTFQEILMDKRAKDADRLIAVELAGDYTVINDTLASTLLNVVGSADQPTELRARAAISLGPALESAEQDGFDDPDEVPVSRSTVSKIQKTLHHLYFNQGTPKEVRRRILEASVRSRLDWHKDAIRKAYSSADRDWKLTAVFAMGWVDGFDKQILDALQSADPEIHLEAVEAAGNWELSTAWPHVLALVEEPDTPKDLLIAAIGAVGNIRPKEAAEVLVDLAASPDEDIADAASEAISLAEGDVDDDSAFNGDASGWIN